MKNFLGVLRSKGVAVKASVAASTLALASGAHAVMPTWATTAGADIGTAIDDSVAEFGPYVIAALVALITIKLIKRFANKV